MDRRRFLLTSLAGFVSTPLAAEAQPAGRIWRIGYLSLVSEKLEQYRPWVAAFRDGLRELGYVEGENVVIEQRYAAGHVERLKRSCHRPLESASCGLRPTPAPRPS